MIHLVSQLAPQLAPHLAPHLAPMIRDLAVILVIAGMVSLLFQRIRQPVVLGYIIAGIIVGPHTPPFPLVSDIQSIRLWAELGVIFLMFSMGLEFSFRRLAKVGVSAAFTACIEVVFMLILGSALGRMLHYSLMDSLFLGAMLSISSTTIIIRTLDELKLKTRRFAEVIFGILVVEDILAILVLVMLTTIAVSGTVSSLVLLVAFGKLVLVVGGWFLAGYLIIPKVMRYVGRVGSDETLALISLGLCLALVVFASYFRYSVALGAFIMGSILAETSESHRIQERIAPLRDLFAAVFFVSIGMLLNPVLLWKNMGAVAIISIVTIVGKIVSTTLGSLLTGQHLKTSVQIGFGLAQIGEFSFIIATLGSLLNVTSDFLYPIAVAVSIVTTFTTPYLIRVSSPLATYLENHCPDRIKYAHSNYILWLEERKVDRSKQRDLYQTVFRWFLNGLIVSIVFVVSSRVLIPFLQTRTSGLVWSAALGWGLAVGISSPFIWAMFSERKSGLKLVFWGLSFVWLGALSLEFFPIHYVILITFGILFGLFVLFYRQIEVSYRWFERQFLSTFQKNASIVNQAPASIESLRGLAPWDVHLVKMKVHPSAPIEMKRLVDCRLRSDYGVNVIAIQRGVKVIVAPQPDQTILPQDELLLLGTDDEIETVRPIVEAPPIFENDNSPLDDYELKQIRLREGSLLLGKTIRSSEIRESFGAILVGIEQVGHRMINPNPDLEFKIGDILWVVGKKDKLEELRNI